MTDDVKKETTKTPTHKDGDLVFINGNRFSPGIVVGTDESGDVLIAPLATPQVFNHRVVKKEEGSDNASWGTVTA